MKGDKFDVISCLPEVSQKMIDMAYRGMKKPKAKKKKCHYVNYIYKSGKGKGSPTGHKPVKI